MLMRYLISVCMIAALPAAAAAQPIMHVSPDDPVDGAPGHTYASLLGQFIPNLQLQPDGAAIGEGGFELDHIEDDITVPAATSIVVHALEAMPIDIEGAPHLALLVDIGAGVDWAFPSVALALYAMDDEPRLVDVADVAGDQLVSFGSPPKAAIGGRDEILMVSSAHGNTGQYYEITSLITLSQGELTLIDAILTLSDSYCGMQRTQSLDVATQEVPAGKWPIEAVVTDKGTHEGEPCDGTPLPVPHVETYSVQYRWDETSQAYVAPTGAWAELDAINEARF